MIEETDVGFQEGQEKKKSPIADKQVTPILDRFEKDFYNMVDQFDKNLAILREEDKSRKGQRYWGDLMLKPLFPSSMKDVLNWVRLILFLAATFFPSYLLADKLIKNIGINKWWLTAIGVLILLLIGYFISFFYYRSRMATLGDPMFHIDAYRKNRSNEYKLYAPFLDEKESFQLKHLRDEMKKQEQKFLDDTREYIEYVNNAWNVQEKETMELYEKNDRLLNEINLLSLSLYKAMELLEKSNSMELDRHDLKMFEGVEIYKLDCYDMILQESIGNRGILVNPLKISKHPNSPHVQILGAEDFVLVLKDGFVFRYDDGDDTLTARVYVSPQMLELLKDQENYARFSIVAICDLIFASYRLFQKQKQGKGEMQDVK